jgi:signal transduction histidine kinase/ligand-binding sensor domain-containing protein
MRVFIAIIFCFIAVYVKAQRFSYSFNRISKDDGMGLLSNNVLSIYQDKQGFIWVGTGSGIQRFDGGKFVRFDPTGTKFNPLPTVAITQILPAADNGLWLAAPGIRQFGVFKFADFSYRVIPLQTSAEVPARSDFKMWQDGYGNTYINVTRYGKILKLDTAKKAFTEETPLNNIPGGWKVEATTQHDKLKKQYWITCDKGLCVYDEQSGQMWSSEYNPQQLPLLNNKKLQQFTSEFHIDSKRRHWVFNWTSKQNFYCFDSSQKNSLNDTAGLENVAPSYNELRKFYETNKGDIWIYGDGGLFSLDAGTQRFQFHLTQYLDNFGIRYDNVNQLMEDRDGVLWIATDQGLYYTLPFTGNVVNLFLNDKPGETAVTDILELKNGDYWLSTWGKAVLTMNKQFQPYPSPLYKAMPAIDEVSKIAYNQIWVMHQHSVTGKIFLGCQIGQLMIYDPSTKQSVYLKPPVFNNSTIRSIAEDKNGNLFFGTQGGRLIKYNGKEYEAVYDAGAGVIIYKLLIDKNGNAWMGTEDKGLLVVNTASGKLVHQYTADANSNTLFSNTVPDFELLNDSLCFAATDALSIINIKTKQVQVISMKEGLPSNSIKKLRIDSEGFLWLVTDNGLCRYDYIKKRFTTYGQKDGFLFAELTNKADYLCSENYVMFAGINTLLFFNPESFRNTTRPPDVTITDFFLEDAYYPVDSLLQLKEIKLMPDQNNFTISFASLDFKNRDKFTYYYKLEGLNRDWIRAEDMSVIYAGLSSGRYTFLVKAENMDGIVTKNITRVNIYIKPPFWRTAWFLSTLLTIVALVAYSIHRLRINRLMAVEKIRNRVARDLHDDMGSTLSTINILSSMAKAKLSSDAQKTAEYINKISDNSQRMMEAMDDIVWAIKPANDSMHKVVGRMREFATNVFEAKDIDLEFIADEAVNNVNIDMEARRDFFLIFKEAVNNAAKYSKCNKALVHVFVEGNKLMLLVKDNGIGFDVKAADSGNGLGNMQKRADALKGKLEISSKMGEGAQIKLSVPLV